MRRWLILFAWLLGLAGAPATAEEGAKDSGRLIEYTRVEAAGLPPQRLTIWLPPGYDQSSAHYPVLYMHDGHNLFELKNSNFNKIWAADKAMLAAVATGRVEPHIIVGIWALGPDRYRQYLPQSAYDMAEGAPRAAMAAMTGGRVISRAYLDWLAGPLKQWVDTSFRTRPGRDDTSIAGSSMGGLMSCYAFLERPETYGRAACVSSHWAAADPRTVGPANPQLIALWDRWFAARLGQPGGRRLWMDHGTATLDAFYAPYQEAIDARVAASGWRKRVDWESKVYSGAEHEENAWAARLPELLEWLLAK